MLGGCVSYKDTGNLDKIDGKVNVACYQKDTGGKLDSSAQMLLMGRTWTFQHDDDPKHKAKSTCHWLQQKKVRVLEWTSQSPDLNIIDPLWGDLKRAVHASVTAMPLVLLGYGLVLFVLQVPSRSGLCVIRCTSVKIAQNCD